MFLLSSNKIMTSSSLTNFASLFKFWYHYQNQHDKLPLDTKFYLCASFHYKDIGNSMFSLSSQWWCHQIPSVLTVDLNFSTINTKLQFHTSYCYQDIGHFMFSWSSKWWRHQIQSIFSVDYGQVYIFIVYNLMSSDLIYLIRSTLLWFTFKLYFTNFIFVPNFGLRDCLFQ